jgi:hypothetical protein
MVLESIGETGESGDWGVRGGVVLGWNEWQRAYRSEPIMGWDR